MDLSAHTWGRQEEAVHTHTMCLYQCMCACMSMHDWTSIFSSMAWTYLIKLWLWGENMSPTESQVDLSFYSKCQICTKSLRVQGRG